MATRGPGVRDAPGSHRPSDRLRLLLSSASEWTALESPGDCPADPGLVCGPDCDARGSRLAVTVVVDASSWKAPWNLLLQFVCNGRDDVGAAAWTRGG
jgi:hypothetical protein